MPTCPGCRERIPYRRLPIHSEHCPGIWTDDVRTDHQSRAVERLHLDTLTRERRLEDRVEALELAMAELGGVADPTED